LSLKRQQKKKYLLSAKDYQVKEEKKTVQTEKRFI
jgi:hypothetical protein